MASRDSTSLEFIAIRRDSSIILTTQIHGTDTVIVDDSLLPDHSYSYRILKLSTADHLALDSSNRMTIRTMDTSNHAFTWNVDTVGDGHSSVLMDIAIVNDTLAYAVGEIYVKDSTGSYNVSPFNFLSYDGRGWKLESITYVPLRAVFAFSPSDVWAGSSAPYHWDGYSWRAFNVSGIFNGYINRFWGTDSRNLYMVGTNGSIARFNGTSWQKMNSGTSIDLTDIWGSPSGDIVWACGWYQHQIGTSLLKNDHNSGWHVVYDGSSSEFSIQSDSLSGPFVSMYANSDRRVFVVSNAGMYKALSPTRGEAERSSFTESFFPGLPSCLRGTGPSDLMIVGQNTFIAHYNGHTWKWFSDKMSNNGMLYSVAQKGNLVIAVGENYDPINSRGLVFMGRR